MLKKTRPRRHVDRGRLYTWLVLAWLFTPILFMAAFSFNDPAGEHNITWQGFTLRWYGDILAYPDLTQAMLNSVSIALLTMVGAGTLGTLLGPGPGGGCHQVRCAGTARPARRPGLGGYGVRQLTPGTGHSTTPGLEQRFSGKGW